MNSNGKRIECIRAWLSPRSGDFVPARLSTPKLDRLLERGNASTGHKICIAIGLKGENQFPQSEEEQVPSIERKEQWPAFSWKCISCPMIQSQCSLDRIDTA